MNDTPRSHTTPTSEKEQAIGLYMQGKITANELVDVMDRHGNWAEQLIRQLSANPSPIERMTMWRKRSG